MRVSRFFLGKNKVMQKAFGVTPEDEFRDNLRHLAKVKRLAAVLMSSQTMMHSRLVLTSLIGCWFGLFAAVGGAGGRAGDEQGQGRGDQVRGRVRQQTMRTMR